MSTGRSMFGGAGDADAAGDASGRVYDDGHLRVEHDNYYVTLKGRLLKLTRTQFLLLSRLTRLPERYVGYEELWAHVWGGKRPYNADSLHVHVYRLRGILAPYGIRIESLVNVGYRISVAAGCPQDGDASSGT